MPDRDDPDLRRRRTAAPPRDDEHTVPLSYRRTDDAHGPYSTAAVRADEHDTRALRVGPAPQPGPWHTRWWVVGTGALVLGLLVGGAVVGGRDLEDAAAVPAPPAATVTVTASPSTVPTPTADAPTDPGASSGPGEFAMPDEVGKYLQDAQDDLQSISGDPLFFTGSTDASGQGRAQILDSGWRVCDQSVTPGTQVAVSDRSISFGTVRLDESCP